MRRTVAIEIISFSFVILFTYAAVSKLLDLELFRSEVGISPMLTKIADIVVWVIPVSELVVAIMLTIPKTRLLALYGAFNLMVIFTGYIIGILTFSDFVPCSCGGILSELGWTEHLVFNIGFATLAASGIRLQTQIQKSNVAGSHQQMSSL